MQNIQTKKVNPRSLSSILTISMLICLFVGFVLGTIKAEGMLKTEGYVPDVGYTLTLDWAICAPYLVFMILALALAVIKFFLCTLPLEKEYSSKDTIKVQFWMEIINLVIILLGCISIAFIKTHAEEPTSRSMVLGPILISTLAFAIGVATAGLAYHNYK